MVVPTQESACHYLFGKEASSLYDTSKISENFVNQSLETLMKINVVFLSRKTNDGFCLIDPAAFNNQCHLYALLAARIKIGYKTKTEDEKLARTEENRFLHLLFLLGWTFLTERKLLCQAIDLASSEKKVTLPTPKEDFHSFIKDPHGVLIRTARQSLNNVFEHYIKEAFCAAKEKSLLHKELYQLSLEDLQHLPSRGNQPLYTLPKLAGVAYLIHETIPIVIKTKVITSKGNGTLLYQSTPLDHPDEPVLLFEAIASDELSIQQFESIAERCPTYFFRQVSSKNRHSEKESCTFCQNEKIDLDPYKKRLIKVTACIQKTFYALGVDFMQEVQTSFIKFFKDESKYPILTSIFQKASSDIDELQVSMKKPLAFTVHHVYLDDAQHALSPQLRMDSFPESFLKERKFL